MLVLSRKTNENIVIDGRIVVKVVRTEGNFVKLGIEAPPEIPVHRQEIYEEILQSNKGALRVGRPKLSFCPGSKIEPTVLPPEITSPKTPLE